MIIKERSLYRKFIDWWDKWRHKMNTNYGTKIPGFWGKGGEARYHLEVC